MKQVYLAFSADILHIGHLRVLEFAASLGEVTVGVLTDQAVASYKPVPILPLEQRLAVMRSIKSVDRVIEQKTLSYRDNLIRLKPDVVVHGDDWRTGIQSSVRREVIEVLSGWGGELVEAPFSDDVNGYESKKVLGSSFLGSDFRRARLKHLLHAKGFLRILEAHNGLTGLIGENASIDNNGSSVSFDGLWMSSLTDSTSRGKPDIEAVDLTTRLQTVNDVLEVTTKPIIFDADTGGIVEHFEIAVKTLERLGVSAVVIEDKVGLKKNSLLGNEVSQQQSTISEFCQKIKAGKASQRSDDFMIVARIESLILGKTVDDALERSIEYVNAGADGVLIHSKNKSPDEIFEFTDRFRKEATMVDIPLIVVPSTFNCVTESQLKDHDIQIVIYANQLLRASYPSMLSVAQSILSNGRSLEVDDELMSIGEILKLIPGTS